MAAASRLLPRFLVALVSLLVILVSGAGSAIAAPPAGQAPPNIPAARFFGGVTLYGSPAPSGATVAASVNGIVCGTAAVSAGQYVLDLQAFSTCGVPGLVVSFTVNGLAASQLGTVPDIPGTAVQLDLLAPQYVPPPLPPPTPPVVPPYVPFTPVLLTPQPGVPIYGSAATFQWTADGPSTSFWLYVGTSPGAGNLFDSGQLPAFTTAQTVYGLPTGGTTVWARLWWNSGAGWQYRDYAFFVV